MDLMGCKALVTGAGSHGIGRAVVLALANAGADVAIAHLRQRAAADALAEEVRAMGRTASHHSADLADPAAARAMVHSAADALGGLTTLVACAARLHRVPFLKITDEAWDAVHAVNLRGTFAVAQEAARIMCEADQGGRIILVSSVNQEHPTHGLAHYVASKGGVKMLARAMALELAPAGITVNLIAPGTVETDLNRAALADEAFRADKTRRIPMHRIAEPHDIAGAAVYLASRSARYVTGATITVDGGLTL
ncbi:MAG: SDR family oxidoreductase [Pseudomonadota bacterium]